jgi:hypothetical protein
MAVASRSSSTAEACAANSRRTAATFKKRMQGTAERTTRGMSLRWPTLFELTTVSGSVSVARRSLGTSARSKATALATPALPAAASAAAATAAATAAASA